MKRYSHIIYKDNPDKLLITIRDNRTALSYSGYLYEGNEVVGNQIILYKDGTSEYSLFPNLIDAYRPQTETLIDLMVSLFGYKSEYE